MAELTHSENAQVTGTDTTTMMKVFFNAPMKMLQHRTLRTVLPYPLHRKLLESIQETYIAFAVNARPKPVNDRLSRLLMLDRQGSPDVLDAWNTYEEELLHLILTIRSQYAGTETH